MIKKIKKIINKLKGLFKKEKVYRELPVTKETVKEMPKALVKDRAHAKADAIKWKGKYKKEKRKQIREKEFDSEEKLRRERKKAVRRILKDGHHFMVFNGRVKLWSAKEEYLGKLTSIIRYKSSVYFYVKEGERKLYGKSGKTLDAAVHFPENLEEQLKHNNLTINFDRNNNYRPQYVIKK